MRKFFNRLFEILEVMGKARTATALTRMGRYKDAQKVMHD
jgi:hypothetical protein